MRKPMRRLWIFVDGCGILFCQLNQWRIHREPLSNYQSPPPPVGIAAKLLSPGPILLFLLPMAALLTACPSPGGGDPGQTGNPVKPIMLCDEIKNTI